MSGDKKQLIADTLLRLGETRGIDKITVKELVECCGISRQTFYYHFQDTLDVVEWIVQCRLEEAVQLSVRSGGPEETIEGFLRSAELSIPLINKANCLQRKSRADQILLDAVRSYLLQMLIYSGRRMEIAADELQALLDFCAGGVVTAIKGKQCHSDEDYRRLAARIVAMIRSYIAFCSGPDNQGRII